MKPRNHLHNSEKKDEMAFTLNPAIEIRRDSNLCIDEDLPSHGKEHLASQQDMLRVPDRAQNILRPWDINFSGGPDIGGNVSLNVNDKRREPSEPETVESVYDLGLSVATGDPYESQKHGRSQSKTIDSVLRKDYSKTKPNLAADPIEDSIRDEMERCLCWSKMDRKEYLPRSAFEEIFNTETVKALIMTIYPLASDEELSRKIEQIIGGGEKSRRMIVAILVFMKQTGYIEDFIREGIFDHHMPLRHERESMREFRARRTGPTEDEVINTTLFKDWERVHVDLFYIYQKMIVVPVFKMDDGSIRSYILDRDVRLPWAKFEHRTSGGHGIVHQLEIHPSHYKFEENNKTGQPQCFAVKEIHAADDVSYSEELRALKKLCARAQKEKHLIKLLLTFQLGQKIYLVFEWADGNLQQFWARKKVESVDTSTRWMLQQCRGIANAVKRIHGLATWQKQERKRSSASGTEEEEDLVKDWGRHGDIKPSNILWFSTYGDDRDHLVVADLGLTRYHSRLTRSRVSRVDGFTGTYRAPEVDLGYLISSKYDIWSLGCVFLEFCIWYLLGAGDIEAFESERRHHHRQKEGREPGEFDNSYFMMDVSSGRKEAMLNPAVEKWVSKLKALESCPPFAHQMLDLVTSQMLVINPKERSSIDKISRELLHISDSLSDRARGQAHSSGTIDIPTKRSNTSVRFKEGSSVIPNCITTVGIRHGQTLSISEVSESDGQSSDEASNVQSTPETSVFGSEQDYRMRQ
ncbi:putative protein kinase domain-containing protein [Colletotrichum sublineola]|uniref:Protein kinase domain-containing protein n=1 Tax=Colletotrichum sublineola TaxID=1173701 RepID=A0A066XPB2_COLSU|nr:putative protein kinase domain-containing protein [Colletotrichum sublineola]